MIVLEAWPLHIRGFIHNFMHALICPCHLVAICEEFVQKNARSYIHTPSSGQLCCEMRVQIYTLGKLQKLCTHCLEQEKGLIQDLLVLETLYFQKSF